MISCEICEIFKKTCFEEYLPTSVLHHLKLKWLENTYAEELTIYMKLSSEFENKEAGYNTAFYCHHIITQQILSHISLLENISFWKS